MDLVDCISSLGHKHMNVAYSANRKVNAAILSERLMEKRFEDLSVYISSNAAESICVFITY